VNGRRQDIRHYEREEVEGVISAALDIATDADVPDELRAVVFTKAADLLAAKSLTIEQTPAMMPFALGPARRPQ